MKSIKITGLFVIGHDGQDHVVYKNGEVVYQGDRIIFVGHNYPGAVDQVIKAGRAIVSPGFIDLEADVDTDHALIDVAIPHRDEDNFIMGKKYRTTDPFTLEELSIRQRMSLAMLIMNGITTAMPIAGDLFRGWAETYEEFETLARNAADLGLRMYLGPSYRAAGSYGGQVDLARGDKSLEDAFRFVKSFDGAYQGLIKGFLSPCQGPYLTEDYLKRSKAFSDETGVPLRLHACEGPHEWDYYKAKYGKTTIDYFDSIGILGPRTLIPHTIVAKDSELRILADRGVSVISTPIAEANLGWGLVSFGKYLHMGINMTIGTDSQPVDMIQNMRFGWNLARILEYRQIFNTYTEEGEVINPYSDEPSVYRTAKATRAADFYRAATTGGAKALGRDDLGKLAPGAKADIIIIDLDDICVGPYEDPIRTLVMSTTGYNVRDVIINGRLVMKNRTLPGIDTKELLEQGQQVYNKFLSLYQEYDLYNRPVNTFFPAEFPIISQEDS